jgi:hypothetical protein
MTLAMSGESMPGESESTLLLSAIVEIGLAMRGHFQSLAPSEVYEPGGRKKF